MKNWSRTRNNLPTQDAISKLSLVPYSRNMDYRPPNQSEKSKSLCTNWWSQPKRRRVSPLHAQHIVVSSSYRPRPLDGRSSASPGKEKRGPSGPRPRPPPISPRDVNRPARLAVDGLGIPEPDPDGRPSAGIRQRVGLGPRGGDESLELGRPGRRGPHLERAAVAA